MSAKNIMEIASEQGKVLKSFSRALGCETHVLIQYPDLDWQEPVNRLQWEPGPIQEE